MHGDTEISHESDVEKQKFIGANEGDFEAILVDGVLGFGMAVATAVLLVGGAMRGFMSGVEVGVASPALCGMGMALFAIVCAVFLRLGQFATDRLQTEVGTRFVLCSEALSFVASIVFLNLEAFWPTVVFAGCGLVAGTFSYARFLGCLTRRALMVVFDAAFVLCGMSMLILSQLEPWCSSAIVILSAALSLSIGVIRVRSPYELAAYVTIADSRQRSVKITGNNHTLFTVGFMLSPAAIVLNEGVSGDVAAFSLGASIGLAGIASLLLERMDERAYKETFKKNMALVAALFMLAVMVVPSEWRTVVVAAYLCLAAVNTIILLNAVVETARFNMISPLWLMGQEGSVFFLGLAVGCLLFVASDVFFFGSSVALGVACAVFATVVVYAQIHINYQVYPFEPVIDVGGDRIRDSEESRGLIERNGSHKRTYQKKREYACEVFRLSPREREILQLLLKGRDARYIMNEFYISQSTAKTHIYNIYRKFEVHSRQDLLDFIENVELPEDPEGDERHNQVRLN